MNNTKEIILSIVIITKNEEENIEKCIKSIQNNCGSIPLSNLEVIVIDSNSTDNTRDTVLKLEKLIQNIYLYNITKSSQYSASLSRSEGLKLAKGKYVLFLDGDMEMKEGFLDEAIKFLKTAEADTIGIIGIRNDFYYDDGELVNTKRNVYNTLKLSECKHFGGAILFEKAKLIKVGGYDNKILASEEPELYLRLKDVGLKVFELPIEMIDHNIEVSHNESVVRKLFRIRSKGIGQSFYKTVKEKRGIYLFTHKPLSIFFIPTIIILFTLILGSLFLVTFNSVFLGSLSLINIVGMIFFVGSKSFKQYIYTTLNFPIILYGVLSYRNVSYSIRKVD